MDDDSYIEPRERSEGQSPKANVGLILAAVIAIDLFPLIFGIYGWRVAGQGDLLLETDRNRWPTLLLETFENSPLTGEDVGSIELTPLANGWFLRMKATPTAVDYVTKTLTPLDEAAANGVSGGVIEQFWESMPHRWRNHKSSANDRFYATRDGNWLARLNDEDKVVLIWSGAQEK